MQVTFELWMLLAALGVLVVAAVVLAIWVNQKRRALRATLADQHERISKLSVALEAAEARVGADREEARARFDAIDGAIDAHAANQTRLGDEVGGIAERIERAVEQIERAGERIERLAASQANTSATIDTIKDYQKQTFADLYARSNAHDASIRALDAMSAKLGAEAEQLAAGAERLARNQANTSNTIDTIKDYQKDAIADLYERVNAARRDLDSPDAKIGALERYMSRNSSVNTVNYRVHNRNLTPELIADILERFAKPLGLDHNANTLSYLAHQMCLLEDRCLGRLGTTIETAIVRALAVQSRFAAAGREVNLIEIGTLFGVAAGAIDIACRALPGSLRLTLIDPLTGYYGNDEPDIVTGVAVTKANLEENLRRIGCDERTTIINRLAETPEAMAAVPLSFADVLIIDGDHSYDGVKRDYDNYAPRTRDDGLILFDDYDTTAWPDIKPYVDGLLAEDQSLEMVASGYRTAIVRRRAASSN